MVVTVLTFTAAACQGAEPTPKGIGTETVSQLNQVTKLHKQINKLSVVVVAGGAGAAFFPPAVAVSGVAAIARFFKVNKHRRLTNELLRKGVR